MKNEHIAYVREVDGQLFYFVKSFIVIPELKNNSSVLVGYGMHLDFDKACDIAGVFNDAERKKIYATVYAAPVPEEAKVISLIDFNKAKGKKIS